jgi:hypothetical protein
MAPEAPPQADLGLQVSARATPQLDLFLISFLILFFELARDPLIRLAG